jgi:hypothetical protein
MGKPPSVHGSAVDDQKKGTRVFSACLHDRSAQSIRLLLLADSEKGDASLFCVFT